MHHIDRYEGASCAFGQYTLKGYIQEFSRLAKDIATDNDKPSSTIAGPKSRAVSEHLRFVPPPQLDKCPGTNGDTTCFGKVFGNNAKSTYSYGDKVQVTFHAANPRHDLRLEGTYMTLERETNTTTEVVLRDGDWITRFEWKSTP